MMREEEDPTFNPVLLTWNRASCESHNRMLIFYLTYKKQQDASTGTIQTQKAQKFLNKKHLKQIDLQSTETQKKKSRNLTTEERVSI